MSSRLQLSAKWKIETKRPQDQPTKDNIKKIESDQDQPTKDIKKKPAQPTKNIKHRHQGHYQEQSHKRSPPPPPNPKINWTYID